MGETTDKILLESKMNKSEKNKFVCSVNHRLGSFISVYMSVHEMWSVTVEENDCLVCKDREQPATTCSSMSPRALALTAQCVHFFF